MGLITHTNIIVDDFNFGKLNPMRRYIYFLSHMHADHWQGLSTNWNYGPIYCSIPSKKLLLEKFPKLQNVIGLDLMTPYKICLNETKTLFIEVILFDSNHCPGSVMMLFRGYMGTILHTGDMRFNLSMIQQNTILYPPELTNIFNEKCSIHIDELIFDNSYCDPMFQFPPRSQVLKEIISIIEKHRDKTPRVYIAIDSLGKEEILLCLAEYFQTLIVLNEERYNNIKAINLRPELFTTDQEQGWIHIIRKSEREEKLLEDNIICIMACGWANQSSYTSSDEKNYLVPYSLHSNFSEMEMFVKSINPSILRCVVLKFKKPGENINNIKEFSSYINTLKNLRKDGYNQLKKKYTDPFSLSKQYKTLMTAEAQLDLMKSFGWVISEQEKTEFLKLMSHDKIWTKKIQKFSRPDDNKDNMKIDQMFLRQKSPQEISQKSIEVTTQKTESEQFSEVLEDKQQQQQQKQIAFNQLFNDFGKQVEYQGSQPNSEGEESEGELNQEEKEFFEEGQPYISKKKLRLEDIQVNEDLKFDSYWFSREQMKEQRRKRKLKKFEVKQQEQILFRLTNYKKQGQSNIPIPKQTSLEDFNHKKRKIPHFNNFETSNSDLYICSKDQFNQLYSQKVNALTTDTSTFITPDKIYSQQCNNYNFGTLINQEEIIQQIDNINNNQ